MWVFTVWQTPAHPSDICRALPELLHGARVTAEVLKELRGFWEAAVNPETCQRRENGWLSEGVPPDVQNYFTVVLYIFSVLYRTFNASFWRFTTLC